MKCEKCNNIMDITAIYKTNPCLDFYAYCHGQDSMCNKEIKYKCSECGNIQDIIEEDLATDKQMHLIDELYYKIVGKTSYDDFKQENTYIFTKNDANKVIKFLNTIIDIDFDKYIDDYINNNVKDKLLRDFIKTRNNYAVKIFIEILRQQTC